LPFCRWWTTNQRSGHFKGRQWKDVSSNSVLTRNGNSTYGTAEWQWHNGTANGNGRTATERWKPGITGYIATLTLVR